MEGDDAFQADAANTCTADAGMFRLPAGRFNHTLMYPEEVMQHRSNLPRC